jgi:hypothetical protein
MVDLIKLKANNLARWQKCQSVCAGDRNRTGT